MATTNNSFHGSIGNLSFYKRNGKTCVRTKGGASKSTINKKPSCAGTLASTIEFGGASRVGAFIRRAIGIKVKYFSDMDMIGRLTGVLRKIVKEGSGEPGARVLNVVAHSKLLEGFEFNTNCSFVSRFKKEISITLAEDQDTAVLRTFFCPETDIAAPDGATSFQLLYTFMRLPSYGVHATTKKYGPLHDATLFSAEVSSALLYTSLTLPVKLNLPLTLPESAAEGTALLCIVGIAFYNEQGMMGREGNGMCVVKVG